MIRTYAPYSAPFASASSPFYCHRCLDYLCHVLLLHRRPLQGLLVFYMYQAGIW